MGCLGPVWDTICIYYSTVSIRTSPANELDGDNSSSIADDEDRAEASTPYVGDLENKPDNGLL